MIGLSLGIRKKTDSILIFDFSLVFRIICFFIGGFVLSSTILFARFSVLAAIVILISLVSGLYSERWIVDREKKRLEHRFGLLFFHRKTILGFESIKQFTIIETLVGPNTQEGKKRMFARHFLALSLIRSDGTRWDIDMRKAYQRVRLEKMGNLFATYCGKDLVTE